MEIAELKQYVQKKGSYLLQDRNSKNRHRSNRSEQHYAYFQIPEIGNSIVVVNVLVVEIMFMTCQTVCLHCQLPLKNISTEIPSPVHCFVYLIVQPS